LEKMIEARKEASYSEMLRECEGLIEWSLAHGYDRSEVEGLTLHNDHHVQFYRSTFWGSPCFFLVWSGIEYIWLKGAPPAKNWGYGEVRRFNRPSRAHIARVQIE
jgi:hypothetical protein